MFTFFLKDLQFTMRMLWKNPAFSVITILTLGLCIGANTAIFSVVDGVILRPLAYPESERLFAIHEIVPAFSHIAPLVPVNGMHFREWRKNAHSFEQLALVGGIALNLTGNGEPERLAAARVSPNLFSMLGAQTQLGRTFLEQEDQSGRDHVVILNNELWIQRFGADRNVIGRKITLDGTPYEVVGVLGPGFHFPKLSQLYAMTISEERPQLWKPLALRDDELEAMGDFNFACIARLRRGIAESLALSELNVVQANITQQTPEKIELRSAMVPLQDQVTGRSRNGLALLLIAVGVVLLIGCVNVANLLLARATKRQQEIAIRSALGASRGRLIRQMLGESLVLSSTGGVLGLVVAYVAIRVILVHAPIDLPRADEVRLDGRVLLFTLTISMLTGLLFGLIPAWRSTKVHPQEAVKFRARGIVGGGWRLRSLLVSIETGLSAVCLIVGGLLLHSFVKLLNVDRGFAVQHIVTVNLSLPNNRYPTVEKKAAFLDSVINHVKSLPGVTSTGISNKLPLSGEGGNNLLALENTKVPLVERPIADIRGVNPDYFPTMGIPLKSGRFFDEADRGRKVALVSALTARNVWLGQNPVGKRLHIGADNSPLMEVVGVVGDVRGVSLDKIPSLTVYIPYWQQPYDHGSLAVRTAVDPLSISSAIRDAVHQIDPELPVPTFRRMEDIVATSVAQRQFQMTMVLLFAVAAALLAGLGIYGVVSYSVVQRTSEMGIRIALGAQRGNIARIVLGQALSPVGMGLAAGIVTSIALSRVLASLLFDVVAADPITICGVISFLGAVAAAATYVPVFRATHVDPMMALRYE